MVSNWSKAGSSAAPPHELNVWKFAESRASELQGLHSIVAQRLDNNFQSQRNKRRRTTGHDDRAAKKKFRKRKAGVGDADKTGSARTDERKVSRRVRRRIELKKNVSSGFVTTGDGTKRLRTHLWLAKRFAMTKLWGFHLPLGLHGRGRGSRALLKTLKHGVLVHDASYYGCVQLEGSEDALQSILSSTLVPSPLACGKEIGNDVLDGVSFGAAMVHHVGRLCDPPIAPVTYMWQPWSEISTDKEIVNVNALDGEQKVGDGSVNRKLWIWIHAAAFKEAYDALLSACEKPVNTTFSARCVSREGHLAKLELMGSKVYNLLMKTLLPVTSCENSWHMKKCLSVNRNDPGESEKMCIFESLDQISSSTIVPLVVKDPRMLTEKVRFSVSESKDRPSSSSSNNECIFENGDLWDATKEVFPPVEESILCMEKQHQRMQFISLSHKTSRSQNASADKKCSRVCSILLLNNKSHADSVTRCSIILPLSWVRPFWNTFVLNGAHAIGLREKYWVSSAIGMPYFPLDFPDCNAYSSLMALESSAISDEASVVPPSKRLLENPLPIPWDSVPQSLENISNVSENSLDQAVGSNGQGISFQGKIVRTSQAMNDLLNNTAGNNQLLFPKLHGRKSCLYKFMKDVEFLKHATAMSVLNDITELCYLRVLISAYKEGVFEQGAIICAPRVTDIKSWLDRSESENQELQIPQSSLPFPYGTQQLKMHKNPTLCESYRWPIGFVTSGFVRGSKKAIGGGICEGRLLCKLREEQWKAFPRKKEIYVLVRNVRSTAHRLGLASVVLEQQEEDVQSM